MNKLISIIVPVYMTEKYLENCIESILAQTYQNMEIILVDDGSPDNCAQICDRYAEKDNRIRVIHQENGGLSCARNKGIDCAKGEYLAFVDSDDSINSQFIEVLYHLCEENECQIAQCDFLSVSENSKRLGKQNRTVNTIMTGREAVGKCCAQPNAVKYNVAWNKLYKKDLFKDIRYPAGKVHEDEFTTYKLFLKAEKVAVTSCYLYWYLQRSDSIMGKRYSLNRLDRLEAYEERLRFLKEKGMENEYSEFLVVYYQLLWSSYESIERELTNCDAELATLQKKADYVSKEILHSARRSFLDNLRAVFLHLPEEEKRKYKALYGNDAQYPRKESFLFPFGEIAKESRIAIYGAGDVGKTLFQQVISTHYAEVVVWVDALWSSFVSRGFPVKPIDSLIDAEYDYVILALRNESVAIEVKANLIDWGIPGDRIVWHEPAQISPIEAVIINDVVHKTNIIKKDQKRRMFLLNTPDHGNLGDHALALAAYKLLQDFFPEYEIWEYTGKQWDYCRKKISEAIRDEDVIFFVGGGYMGDMWQKESIRVCHMIEQFPCNAKIFLPQSFYYQESDYESDREFYQAQKNILYIHREEQSYQNFMRNIVADNRINWIYPDTALYIRPDTAPTKRKGVKFCIRTDKESDLDDNSLETVRWICEKMEIPYSYIDTVVSKNVNTVERENEVRSMLTKISAARLLITDRLHGMLFAAITGTPCIAFDNITKKVNGVYQWIKNLPYIQVMDIRDVNEDTFISLYEMRNIAPDMESIRMQFAEMARRLRAWLKKDLQ